MPEKDISADAIGQFRQELNDMRDTMRQVAEALTRLTLLEERHQNVAATNSRILEQLEMLKERQHVAELGNVSMSQAALRITTLEKSVRELTLDSERQKSALSTATWMVKGAWAAGTAVAGVLVWAIQFLPKG